MMSGVPEVDEDGFGVANVEEAVGFRWESSDDFAVRGGEVGISHRGFDLRVASWLMKFAKETFLEEGAFGC